jgi:AbrB family looped-hinge helix DNA binding protein
MSKIVRSLPKGQITIPAQFRERLGIDQDSLLNIILLEDRLEVVPVRIGEQESLREYTDEEIKTFLQEDKIDPETAGKVRELLAEGRI